MLCPIRSGRYHLLRRLPKTFNVVIHVLADTHNTLCIRSAIIYIHIFKQKGTPCSDFSKKSWDVSVRIFFPTKRIVRGKTYTSEKTYHLHLNNAEVQVNWYTKKWNSTGGGGEEDSKGPHRPNKINRENLQNLKIRHHMVNKTTYYEEKLLETSGE